VEAQNSDSNIDVNEIEQEDVAKTMDKYRATGTGFNYHSLYEALGIWRPAEEGFDKVIQGDSGVICNTLGNYSMCDSKQKSSYGHG
jgi:hypothetical protein